MVPACILIKLDRAATKTSSAESIVCSLLHIGHNQRGCPHKCGVQDFRWIEHFQHKFIKDNKKSYYMP